MSKFGCYIDFLLETAGILIPAIQGITSPQPLQVSSIQPLAAFPGSMESMVPGSCDQWRGEQKLLKTLQVEPKYLHFLPKSQRNRAVQEV